MLVASSHLSVAMSSGVVGVFTTLLFLSGYILQQQTVRSIQDAIKPKTASSITVPTVNPTLSRHFGRPPGHSFFDKYLASNRPKGGWAKTAYVQLLRSHTNVCNALTTFAALDEQESLAQRVILYPAAWDKSDPSDRAAATSRRLLRQAASRYKVMLHPIGSVSDQLAGEGRQQDLSDEENYPLVQLLALLHFNRVVYLQPSGVVLDVSPLDLLFSVPLDEDHGPVLGLSSPYASVADRPAVLLIQPSKKAYVAAAATLPEGAYPDSDFFAQVKTESAAELAPKPSRPQDGTADSQMTILTESSSLHNVDADFDATNFLQSTGYVHLQDAHLEGPEYYASADELSHAAPARNPQASQAWRTVYDKFRDARLEICGLDLESAEHRPKKTPQSSQPAPPPISAEEEEFEKLLREDAAKIVHLEDIDTRVPDADDEAFPDLIPDSGSSNSNTGTGSGADIGAGAAVGAGSATGGSADVFSPHHDEDQTSRASPVAAANAMQQQQQQQQQEAPRDPPREYPPETPRTEKQELPPLAAVGSNAGGAGDVKEDL